MENGGRKFLFLIYLIVGLYLINFGFEFVTIPQFITDVNKWIFVGAAALIIIDSFRFLKEDYSSV